MIIDAVKSWYDRIAEIVVSGENQNTFPEREFSVIKDEGLLEIVLPGRDLTFDNNNTAQLLHLLKKAGSASLPVGRIFEGHINALYLLHLFGTDQQKDFYFNEVAIFKKISGVWNSQGSQGVKIHDKGDGNYILEGGKIFCSGAGWLDFPIITGELISENKRGWQMCILNKQNLAFAKSNSDFWNPMGMLESVSYKMDFTGIELTDDDLLGPPDAYYGQPYYSGGAIRFAAVQLGAAEAMYNAAQSFLKKTNRTNDSFQKARMGEIAFLIETGNLWIDAAGKKADEWTNQPEDAEKMVTYANMMRSIIEEVCLRCMQLAERSVGSAGFLKPNPIERIHRDLTVYLRQPAPDESLADVGKYVFNQPGTTDLWK